MIRLRMHGSKTKSATGPGGARTRHRRRYLVPEGLEVRVLLSGGPTDYLVDLTTDAGTGSNGTGDLLYCINQANANPNTAGSVIEFDPTVFTPATPQTIKLSSTLELNETAGKEMIVGPGASVVTISGNKAVEVFSVSSDTMATLSGLTITAGLTDQDGGGLNNQGTLTVTTCTFTDNSTDAAGGGITNDGTLTLTDSTIEDNSAEFGGGLENEGTLTVTGSMFEDNTATFGGGIDDDDAETATLTGITVSSNSAATFGGGIFYSGTSPLTVTGSTLSSNTAVSGGGIYNEGDGNDGNNQLTIASCTVSDNSAKGTSASSGGGGLFNRGAPVTITASTFSGNTAASFGGGIYATAGALTITDSTVADNSAVGVGAGIDEATGTLKAVNCTIADNNEPSTGAGLGGGINIDQGTATLDNTIIALNTDGTGTGASPDNLFIDGSGTVSSASANNLIGAGGGNSGLTNGSNGNQVGVVNPGLAALADNGGPTQTIALLSGSPAINAGSPALAQDANLTDDQRGAGFPRVVNGTVDMGAVEGTVGPTIFIVDLTSDTGAGSGNEGDLLFCVTKANANTNGGGSEIEFDPTVFSTASPQTIKLASRLVLDEPSGPEVIDGPGDGVVTVSGNFSVGVFQVAGGATATLSGLTISNGSAVTGGGIENGGTLTVTDCTIADNQAIAGGGVENAGGVLTVTGGTIDLNSAFATSGADGLGGGIDNEGGTATITGTTLANNQAADFTSNGGGIENHSGLMSITDSTLSGNLANGVGSDGGGIDNEGTGNLTIADSTLSGNTAFQGYGGGLFNGSSGTVTITDTSILKNVNQAGVNGGGVNNQGTMEVIGSTIADNLSPGLSGGINNVAGGTLILANSTIAGNTAVEGGGGIDSQGKLTAVNCTIADNDVVASVGYGGGIGVAGATVMLNNTIVALNTIGTGTGATANDIGTIDGGTVSGSFNLVGTGGAGGLTGGVNGNLVGVASPGLGTLASNGGPTQTIALLAGSPAINAGNPTLANDASLTTDQRGTGFAREVDGTVDIGAFEVQAVTSNPAPHLLSISPDEIAVGHAAPLTLTVTGSGFVGQSVVEWNSTALATAYDTGSTLTATIPASDFATEGSFSITVVNPTPGGGTSNAATFHVIAVPTSVYVDGSYASDATGTVVTWTDGSKHTVGFDAFGTVQAGVSAVAPGGTVSIAAGTYTELVTISQSLTLAGAGAAVTTIQASVNFFASSDEVAIASGASVGMSGLTVAGGANTGVGIADEGGTLTAAEIEVSGFYTSVAVQEHAAAKITDSTISSNKVGIIVGSSTGDTSTLTAHNNNLSGAGAGVWNLQASGSVDATLNRWGSTTGPTTSANPGGTGSASAGNVQFSPWLGDSNLDPFDYLVFSTTAGDNYVVTPIDGNTELDVTSGDISLGPLGTIQGISLGTVPSGDTLGFSGNGGTITIRGEAGTISDQFMVADTSVQYAAPDGIDGTTINFIGTGMTRDVVAVGLGGDNYFGVDGLPSAGGTPGRWWATPARTPSHSSRPMTSPGSSGAASEAVVRARWTIRTGASVRPSTSGTAVTEPPRAWTAEP